MRGNNGQTRCLVQVRRLDGTVKSSIVYGATAANFRQAWNMGGEEILLSVEDIKDYKEEGHVWRSWIDRLAPPSKFYFNKYLKREPISDPPRENGGQARIQEDSATADVRDREVST